MNGRGGVYEGPLLFLIPRPSSVGTFEKPAASSYPPRPRRTKSYQTSQYLCLVALVDHQGVVKGGADLHLPPRQRLKLPRHQHLGGPLEGPQPNQPRRPPLGSLTLLCRMFGIVTPRQFRDSALGPLRGPQVRTPWHLVLTVAGPHLQHRPLRTLRPREMRTWRRRR